MTDSDTSTEVLSSTLVAVYTAYFRFDQINLENDESSRAGPSSNLLVVPNHVKTATASRVAAPTIWNNLPEFVEDIDSFNVFKCRLKSHMLDVAFKTAALFNWRLCLGLHKQRSTALSVTQWNCIVLKNLFQSK